MGNEPEELPDYLQGGDEGLGNQLSSFFIDLLKDKNLAAYHADREGYIRQHLDGRAAELLMSQDFIDIERHILAVTGSSRAKLLFVVSPPY